MTPAGVQVRRWRPWLGARETRGVGVVILVAHFVGFAVTVGVLLLGGKPSDLGHHAVAILVLGGTFAALALAVGVVVSLRRHPVEPWMSDPAAEPSLQQSRSVLRLPRDTAVLSGLLWLSGAVAVPLIAVALGAPGDKALRMGVTTALGGLSTSDVAYLLAERESRPLLVRALAAHPPEALLTVSVLSRLVLTWALASGVPLLGILLVYGLPGRTRSPIASTVLLATIGLAVGALTTALVARAVGSPLRDLRGALAAIESGRTDVVVAVDDASEIGLLQNGVNAMTTALRERERLQDLFGRHVGPEVAEHAWAVGADLSGEVRPVAALFVDVIGSTRLATQVEPHDLVARLNRFFEEVVRAVEAGGGLLNKFEGDAALCVFGAPRALDDPAGAALAAAVAMRDAVVGAGELDLGIGIACGPAFAGQLGTLQRLEYTVIGDPVNEAARLAGLAKALPGRIAATASVVETAHARAGWTAYDEVVLRGRAQPTQVWVPDAPAPAR